MTNLNGGSPFTYTGQTINVGTITSDVWVHIYDDSGVDESVGTVHITGMSDGGRLFFQVCTSTDTDAFDNEPNLPITSGLRNFGGLTIATTSTTDPTETSLRDNTSVVLAVAGDITGNVTAGQLYRIDALNYLSGSTVLGGHISGDLTATNGDFNLSNGQKAIPYVRAANEVSGDITATGYAPFSTAGSIGRLVLSPTTDSVALSGDIDASTGSIAEVFTTGHLGTSTNRIAIDAGKGIGNIRAVGESASSTDAPLDRDFYADIQTNVVRDSLSSLTLMETAPPARPVSSSGAHSTVPSSSAAASTTRTSSLQTGKPHTSRLAHPPSASERSYKGASWQQPAIFPTCVLVTRRSRNTRPRTGDLGEAATLPRL